MSWPAIASLKELLACRGPGGQNGWMDPLKFAIVGVEWKKIVGNEG